MPVRMGLATGEAELRGDYLVRCSARRLVIAAGRRAGFCSTAPLPNYSSIDLMALVPAQPHRQTHEMFQVLDRPACRGSRPQGTRRDLRPQTTASSDAKQN